jgi:hypothetical protein
MNTIKYFSTHHMRKIYKVLLKTSTFALVIVLRVQVFRRTMQKSDQRKFGYETGENT